MRPNLFDFATKELSQDAFLAWLIQWASPEYRDCDRVLYEVATSFLNKLLSLQIKAPPGITSVKVERQWNKIDVSAKVNNEYLLIIEDKTATSEHSNQLQKYRETGADWCKEEKHRQMVCVYLRTGSESGCALKKIEEQGFAVFGRREFLRILGERDITNQIFTDFREHLQMLEDSENQFLTKPIGDWRDPEWRGFYQALEGKRGPINWSYVPNQSGGFWNAVLNWHEMDDCYAYMQIEQGPLCFKVGEISKDHKAVRSRYSDAFMKYCGDKDGIRRPKRFGCGTYMTIACVDRAVWLGSDGSLVDTEKVNARLRDYEKLYSEFLDKVRSESASDSTNKVTSS
jgi:hypothetical protein